MMFGYQVRNPERYGVLGFDANGNINSIKEKPKNPASRYAITGLYFLDQTAPDRAKKIMPSKRGELEITTLLETYLNDGTLTVERMGRGLAWFDTGTHRSLLDAGNFVRTLIERQGLQIGSPEEIAYRLNWISSKDLEMSSTYFVKNYYGTYLRELANSEDDK